MLVLFLSVLSGFAVRIFVPRSGLLIPVPFGVILYPLNQFARFIQLEATIVKNPSFARSLEPERGWIDLHPLMSMTAITISVAVVIGLIEAVRVG